MHHETRFEIILKSKTPLDTNHCGQMIHTLLAKMINEIHLKGNLDRIETLLTQQNRRIE